MDLPATTISQAQLVDNTHPGKKLPQYIAAMAATLGALAAGTMLGWASPAGPRLMDGEYGFPVSESENAWVGSLATLGGAFVCYPIGFIMEKIGRKITMLLLVFPFTLGWLLIIFAPNVDMLYAGRFFTGLAGGAFCITAPAYTSEIAQDSIRGTLGTFFQLMITIGILFAYAVGGYVDLQILSIICACIPVVFVMVFFFMPESPYALIKSGKEDAAKASLRWLRGDQYDVDSEYNKTAVKIEEERNNPTSFKDNFSQKAAQKSLIICLSLMFFQQFSGINAVLFNTTQIFISAGSTIPATESSIIIAVIQVVATLFSTLVIDRLGRKILLMISSIAMGICGVLLGVYFYLSIDVPDTDPQVIENMSWLPLFSLCIFIVAFSIGFGPIPWLVSGDLCTPNIKAFVSSSAGTFNWVMAFVITTTFVEMQAGLGEGGAFWLFAGFTFLGAIFVLLVVPETKGKSNDEVQLILNGKNSSDTF